MEFIHSLAVVIGYSVLLIVGVVGIGITAGAVTELVTYITKKTRKKN